MTKEAKTPDALVDDRPTTFDLTVAEFCARLSGEINKVELIAAFHAHQTAIGNIKGSMESFREAFDTFAGAPA